MPGIIVAFPKVEDAKKIKNLLIRNEYAVITACNSGAQVISVANQHDDLIVICGYRLSDMHYSELYNYLPRDCRMLLVASPLHWEEGGPTDIVRVSMPIKVKDLLDTVEMMTYEYSSQRRRKKERSNREKETIALAKSLLMDRNGMTEDEAHRYIQKISMDSGNRLVETAEMILALN